MFWATPKNSSGSYKMCVCNQKHFKMPRKSLKKFFNFHLRKKRSSQEKEEKLPEQDIEPALSEPIASRRHARNAKIRCIKSLSMIIRNEKRFGLRERARARAANENREQRKQRLEVMRRLASKRLAAESTERRQQRLRDLRRRAAQRIERERQVEEQKRRTALRLSYLPTYKCAVSPDVPNVVLERLKLYNIVGVSTSKEQQKSELTNSTHNDGTGSWERNSPLRDDGEDDDDNTDQEFDIDIKVEPDLDDEWELNGDGDRQSADVFRNWYHSDEMDNNEENGSRSRQDLVDKPRAAEPEIDDIDIKEEPLDEEFNNIVLERTVLMMCRDG